MAEPLRARLLELIGRIAPEADLASVTGNQALRDQLDIDSMDMLNLIVSIHEAMGIDIPERDYGQLATLDAMCAYIEARLAAGR